MVLSLRQHFFILSGMIVGAACYCKVHALITSQPVVDVWHSLAWGLYLFSGWGLVLLFEKKLPTSVSWPLWASLLFNSSIALGTSLLMSLLFSLNSGLLENLYSLIPLHLALSAGFLVTSDQIKTACSQNNVISTETKSTPQNSSIEVLKGSGSCRILLTDIILVSGARNYLELSTSSGSYLLRCSMRAFLTQYGTEGFVQVHRSHIVNSGKIKGTVSDGRGGRIIELKNDCRVKVGKQFAGLDFYTGLIPA